MIDRKKGIELIQLHEITKQTVAVVADVDPAQVTNYTKGVRISTATESAIGTAITGIVAVIEKAKPIRPDISDGQHMKDLIRKWREEGCFVVLIGGNQTSYFAANKGRLITTRFLLQATPLTIELAETIAERLSAEGYKAIAIENPYGVIDSRHDDLAAVWHEKVPA